MTSFPVSLQIADLAWTQVEAALKDGYDTAIIPVGATEQHGPHLPAGADTLRANALALRLGARLGGALIAPTIAIGCSEEHRDFPATISLKHETLAAVLVDVAVSLAGQGFRRLIFLSAHGGNAQALALALEELSHNHSRILFWPPTVRRSGEIDIGLPETAGISSAEAGIHAGERETSEVLAVRPDLVRMNEAEAGYVGDMATILPALRAGGVRVVSPNGVLGDPRQACIDRGEAYLTAVVEALAGKITCHFYD